MSSRPWPLALAALLAGGCSCGAATGTLDGGRRDSGRRDAQVVGTDGEVPQDARPGDAGDACGGRCEPFQYCDAGRCREYPACAGDGTCSRAGDVCVSRRCVPGTIDIDGDGVPASMDCDETNPMRFPGNPEICSPIDEDCDERIDEGDPVELCAFYPGGGVCSMSSCGCPPGTFDLDRAVPGCECTAAPSVDQGQSCDGAIDLGMIDDSGQRMMITGNVLPDDREVWYRVRGVDGTDTACDNYHVRIQLTDNPDDTFEFTVFRGDCSTLECENRGYTDYRWATDFRTMIGGRLAGQCPCYGMGGTPAMDVSECSDDSADYYIRVRRRAGAALSCVSFALEVSNGVYDTM